MNTATTEIYTYGHTLSLHDALPIFRTEARSIRPRHREFGSFDHCSARGRWRKAAKRVDRPLAIMARPVQRIGNRLGRFQEAEGMGEIGVARALARHRLTPEPAVRVAAPRIGEDHRQRHLAVAKVVALVLAHGRFVR